MFFLKMLQSVVPGKNSYQIKPVPYLPNCVRLISGNIALI